MPPSLKTFEVVVAGQTVTVPDIPYRRGVDITQGEVDAQAAAFAQIDAIMAASRGEAREPGSDEDAMPAPTPRSRQQAEQDMDFAAIAQKMIDHQKACSQAIVTTGPSMDDRERWAVDQLRITEQAAASERAARARRAAP